MAKTPVILRERAPKQTPGDLLVSLDAQISELKKAKDMLIPMADIGTFTALMEEVQAGRSGQDQTLKSVMSSLDGISVAFGKAAMESAANSKQAVSVNTKETSAAVVAGIAAILEKTQEEIRLAILNSEKTNKLLAKAVTKIATSVAENTKPLPLPTIEAVVTERDTLDRLKKFEMREVSGD